MNELRRGLAKYQAARRAAIKGRGLLLSDKTRERARRVSKKDLGLVAAGEYAEAVANWCGRVLKVPVGIRVGKPFRIYKWQKDFLCKALGPGVVEACLCVSRKNGKSGLISVLLLSYLVGPLNTKNWRCCVVSLTGRLASELRKQIAEIAEASGIDGLLKIRTTPAPGRIIGLNASEVSILCVSVSGGILLCWMRWSNESEIVAWSG